MLKFPKTALMECPDAPDFWLVEQGDVTMVPLLVVEDPTAVGDAHSAAEDAHAAAEDAHTAPAEKPRIVGRPQAYNGQSYFTMLHSWAGRSAGGFGKPAGFTGNGSYARWAHRRIPSVAESGLQGDFDHQVMLFEEWLKERSLLGYVAKVDDALQYPSPDDVVMPKSVYYTVPSCLCDSEASGWETRWHGTYIYTLWNIVAEGLKSSGTRGEGGDTHMRQPVVYATPNPQLAYSYALPHQMFGNGYLFKAVLDLRVSQKDMVTEFNKFKYNWETVHKAQHVQVVGFWFFVDSHAEKSDSRLLEWDANMETIPQTVVEFWAKEGCDHETTVPRIITDPNPVFMPLTHTSWSNDRTVISS